VALDDDPMIYPLLFKNSGLRERLIENKIYIPQWWKEVIKNTARDSIESYLSQNLIPLPIDHRFNRNSLDFIANLI